jgi:hypothetical protein
LRHRIAELQKMEADHKQTDKNLRESEERFRAFMENNPADIGLFGARRGILGHIPR